MNYLVRTREIDPDFMPVEQAHKREGQKLPADHEDDGFVGLYSNPGNTEKL